MRLRKKQRPVEEFQMAPMIDMVFLLLVFFMCVSSLAEADRGVEIDLPESGESKVPEEISNRGMVSVQEDGSIHLGTVAVTLHELEERIRNALRETPELRVQVRADKDTRFETIQSVLRACAEAGAHDIIYATYQMN